MRRKVLLISVLLLVLILLSATPTVAKGPPRIKRYVDFDGALVGDGELYVDEKGTNIAVYGYMPVNISVEGYPFAGYKSDFGLRLTLKGTETGEVKLGSGFDAEPYEFDEAEDCVKLLDTHNFGGSGTYIYDGAVYTVTLEDASFGVLVDAYTNKKCAGYGTVFDETPFPDNITFTVKIGCE